MDDHLKKCRYYFFLIFLYLAFLFNLFYNNHDNDLKGIAYSLIGARQQENFFLEKRQQELSSKNEKKRKEGIIW